MSRHVLPAVAVVLVVATAGCAFYPVNTNNEIRYTGDVEYANGTFHMDGGVYAWGGRESVRTYRDVQVTLYDADRSVIRSEPLGTLSTDTTVAPFRQQVNITTETRPKYVIIESPSFWTDWEVSVIAWVWYEDAGDYDATTSRIATRNSPRTDHRA